MKITENYKIHMGITIPIELRKIIENYCRKHGIPFNQLIEDAVREKIKREEEDKNERDKNK